jgi:hypothetical protein
MKMETMFNIQRPAVWRLGFWALLTASVALVFFPDVNPVWLVGTAVGTFVCASLAYSQSGDHHGH